MKKIFQCVVLAVSSLTVGFTTYPGTPFVDVNRLDPSIRVDLRYASKNNFTGRKLAGYEAQICFLLPSTAKRLALVQEDLREKGLGLKVYDCYRPKMASKEMVLWAKETGNNHLLGEYISSVSTHGRGDTVDLTLVDLLTGEELDMGRYDEFSPEARTKYGKNDAQRKNRLLLKNAMERRGFSNYSKEWWHYQDSSSSAKERFDVPIRK